MRLKPASKLDTEERIYGEAGSARHAAGGAPGGVAPRAEHRIARRGGGVIFRGGEELSADQPAHGGLHGTLGDTDVFGDFLIADLDDAVLVLLLGSEPEIDEEGHRAVVVADQVAEENVHDVIVEGEHASSHYSNS